MRSEVRFGGGVGWRSRVEGRTPNRLQKMQVASAHELARRQQVCHRQQTGADVIFGGGSGAGAGVLIAGCPSKLTARRERHSGSRIAEKREGNRKGGGW